MPVGYSAVAREMQVVALLLTNYRSLSEEALWLHPTSIRRSVVVSRKVSVGGSRCSFPAVREPSMIGLGILVRSWLLSHSTVVETRDGDAPGPMPSRLVPCSRHAWPVWSFHRDRFLCIGMVFRFVLQVFCTVLSNNRASCARQLFGHNDVPHRASRPSSFQTSGARGLRLELRIPAPPRTLLRYK